MKKIPAGGRLAAVLLIWLCWLGPALAEEKAPGEPRFSLREMVLLAMQGNLDVMAAGVDPAIRQAEVQLEKGTFDPVLFTELAGVGASQTLELLGDQDRASATAVLRHKTPSGISYSVEYQALGLRADLLSAFPSFQDQGDTTLNLTVPILRDAGSDVNLSRVRIAVNAQRSAVLGLHQQALDTAAAVERGYWALVRAMNLLDVRRRSRDQAQEFVDMLEEGIKEGVLAPFEAFEARQQLATSQADVEGAQLDLELAQQSLLRLLRMDIPGGAIWPDQIPAFEPERPDLAAMLEEALRKRPEIERQRLALESSRLQRLADENSLLPRLDLRGQYRVATQRDDLYRWQVGVALEVPLGNRAATGAWERARAQEAQASLRLENTRQAVTLEVAQATRAVYNTAERARAATRARQAAQARLEAEFERFRAGLTTAHLVVFAQQQLLDASTLEVVAEADYHLAVVGLDRARGVTLENYSIAVEAVP